MQISSKGTYGVRAMFDLAQRFGEGPIQSEAIAARQGIPVNYLNQLLTMLRRAGLILSLRGAQGGHLLARAPDQISLLEILTTLEGAPLVGDVQRDDLHPGEPDDYAQIAALWQNLREQMEALLGAITLEDLIERKRQQAGHLMYHI